MVIKISIFHFSDAPKDRQTVEIKKNTAAASRYKQIESSMWSHVCLPEAFPFLHEHARTRSHAQARTALVNKNT